MNYQKIRYKCDMLIDQNRTIGPDHVGYSCSNPAEYEHQMGYLLCDDCLSLLRNEPHRITFPETYGRSAQDATVKFLVERFSGCNFLEKAKATDASCGFDFEGFGVDEGQ